MVALPDRVERWPIPRPGGGVEGITLGLGGEKGGEDEAMSVDEKKEGRIGDEAGVPELRAMPPFPGIGGELL